MTDPPVPQDSPAARSCPCGKEYLVIISGYIGDTPEQARERHRRQHYDELLRRYVNGDDSALPLMLEHVS
jgi:hypothetical protein